MTETTASVPARQRLALLFAGACLLIIPLLAFSIIKIYGPQAEQDAYTSLGITVRLKSQMVESWLSERQRDGEILAGDNELVERVYLARQQADPRHLAWIRQRIDPLRTGQGYAAAFLLKADGQSLLSLGETHQISPELHKLAEKALATGKPVLSNFFLDAHDGLTALEFVIPLLRKTDAGTVPAGILVLHSEPQLSIFDLILAWPSASPSGETLLVRRDGDDVLFLNPLRHLKTASLSLRRPLGEVSLPATAAIRSNAEGTMKGRDYRGVEVLTAYRPIAGTDWHAVAKLDYDEVMAPLWNLVVWVSVVALLAVLVIGLLLRRFWIQQESLYRLAAHTQEMKALRESEARFRAVTETGRDAIITAGADGCIVDCNSAARQLLGFSAGEIVGQPLTRIIPERFHQRAMSSLQRMLDGDPERMDGSVAELLARRKDGSEVLVERSIALWATDSGRFYTFAMRDITERRAIEDQLRLHAAALEASASAIIITDSAGVIEWANPAFCAMSGYPAGETIGRKPQDLLKSGLQNPEVYRELWETILAGKVWQGEIINRRKDRSHYIEEQSITPICDKHGNIHHFIAIKQDISRRKEQEEQTRELLVTNETILANAMVGIAYLKNRRICSCNRRLEEIFQYAPGELLGQLTAVLYDSPGTFEKIGEDAYRVVGEGRSFTTEVRLRHKDGSIFWGALSGRAIDPAKPHDGSIWVYADISERRQAEQETSKLLQAVEHSPVSIVITNRQGIIEYVNPGFTRITGYTREDTLGKTPSILKSEFTSRSTHDELWQTILGGRIWHGILHNRRKNGELIWEETSISPIFDAAGEITHFVAVKDDVTERKRIEEELKVHQAHLEELVAERTAELSKALEAAKLADRSKDEFLANITHELRTPLAAVIGFSSLARPMCADPRQREYLDKVNTAGKTLSEIIDDLLDLSKIVAGRMGLEVSPFSPRQMVERVHSVISYKAQEKGLELIEHISDEIPGVLIGNSLRIEQILLNLLSNAVKFTDAGRVELRIGLRHREAQRVCLQISVSDTGIGLSAEGISHLFKPFSQADASITRRFGGTGLGLAICKRLAQMMEGDISVISQEGRGSTFEVHLWLGLGSGDALPVDAEEATPGLRVRYQEAHVLVVDDQPFNRELVAGLLAAVGIDSQSAGNGAEAIRMIEQTEPPFDLVLMDIRMPVMDGLTATRALRDQPAFADLPIVAMTAHTMTHEKNQSFAAGMNDHIGKPFDEATFYRVLAKWIPVHKQSRPQPDPQTQVTQVVQVAGGTHADTLVLKGVDTRAGLALLQGDQARYRHWLGDFLTQAPVAVTQIGKALAGGENDAASMGVHSLKGRMGLLGMKEMHAIAAALEAAVEAGDPAAGTLFPALEQGIAVLCEEIRRELGEPGLPCTTASVDD